MYGIWYRFFCDLIVCGKDIFGDGCAVKQEGRLYT